MDVEEGNRGRGEEASVVALSGRRAVRRVRIRPAPPEGTFVLRQHPLPANPAPLARLSACAPGRNPDGRRVGGIRKSYATSGRTDGRTDGRAHHGTSERPNGKSQPPTTKAPARSSLQAADITAHRTAGARILLPPPPPRRCCHAESLLLGRLDANVGGRKVVKGCSSLPCPLRDLAPSFLLSCPPSYHLLPRGCLAMPRGPRRGGGGTREREAEGEGGEIMHE